MVYFTVEEILQIFEELPRQRGGSSEEIAATEREFGGEFPPIYKRLMLFDEQRILATGSDHSCRFFSIAGLTQAKRDAFDVLREEKECINDWSEFHLQKNHVVFAWEEISCFYWFEAIGRDDVPVYRYVYSGDWDGRKPIVISSSVRKFMVNVIRKYLKL